MFTGIIEEIGHVRALRRGTRSFIIEIEATTVTEGTRVGDSIAVNGTCLTVTRIDDRGFAADVMPATATRTALATLRPGRAVNLERAVVAGGRLGGHIVTGHVDATGRVEALRPDDTALWLTIAAPATALRYIAAKGSIAIDGASLTVADVTATTFSVSLIPLTQGATTLATLRVGDTVNLECDIIAKYVEKLCRPSAPSGLTLDFLRENGF